MSIDCWRLIAHAVHERHLADLLDSLAVDRFRSYHHGLYAYRKVEQLLILRLFADPCFLTDNGLAASAEHHLVALEYHGRTFGGVGDLPVVAYAVNEKPAALRLQISLEIRHLLACAKPVVVDPVAAECHLTQRRAVARLVDERLTHLGLLLHAVLTALLEAAHQSRTHESYDPCRAGGAEHVGDGIHHRHHIVHRLLGRLGDMQAVDGFLSHTDHSRNGLRTREQTHGLAGIVARQLGAKPCHAEADHADHCGEYHLRKSRLAETSEELRSDAIADSKQKQQEENHFERRQYLYFRRQNAENHAHEQYARDSAQSEHLVLKFADKIPQAQSQENRHRGILHQKGNDSVVPHNEKSV